MSSLNLGPGSKVSHHQLDAIVLDAEDLSSVLLQYVESGTITVVRIEELGAPTGNLSSIRAQRLAAETLQMISDKRWTRAQERIRALRPLLNLPRYRRGRKQVEQAAKQIQRSPATVYRLLADFDRIGSLRVLLRLPRLDKGTPRLQPKVERAIRAVLKTEYLKPERITAAAAINTVQRRCRRKGWPVPSSSAIKTKISLLPPVVIANSRTEKKGAAPGRFEQRRGTHPEVQQILHEWQLDHTPSDFCIVDSEYRLPIEGAQTLSVTLDICSRCVPGFTLSMEAPSTRVAGAVMAFSILPKEAYLKDLGLDAKWPCWGKPTFLYMDSGPDFTSSDFERALDIHNIFVMRRPKKSPNYAAHIESLFSKFLREVHQLEGSRFSNLKDRMKYDTAGRAIMTIDEFRLWFTIFITMVYHHRAHSGLAELPPYKAWERGVLGYGDVPGIGLPDIELDPFRLKLDFLPSVTRTIQVEGVTIGRSIFQCKSTLARWVGAKNPLQADGKFVFKFDPFDMSEIYFLDPEVGDYFPIPREGGVGHVTLWDLESVKRQARRENRGHVDQGLIDEGAEKMRAVRREAALKTKKARRNQQRDQDAAKQSVPKQRRAADHAFRFSDVSVLPTDDADEDVIQPLPGSIAAKVDSK